MMVYVSQEHIEAGIPNNCARCPVALAIQDAWPTTPDSVQVFHYEAFVDGQSYTLPDEVTKFIYEFDEVNLDESQRSFEFELPMRD